LTSKLSTSTVRQRDERELVPSHRSERQQGRHIRGRQPLHRAQRSRLDALGRLPYGLQITGVLSALLGVEYWPLFLGREALPTAFLRAYPALASARQPGSLPLRTQQLTDLTTQQYPWQLFNAAALRSGHLPQWNPHLLMGVPEVASWLPAVFDPWHIGYLVLPAMVWWNLLFPLHQLAAGLGAALLGRRLTGSRVAGLIAGMMYAFSGFVQGHNGQNQGELACLFPFLLLAVLRLADNPNARRAVVVGLVLAAMVLTGHPETLAFACGTAAVLAIVLVVKAAAADRRPFTLNLCLGGLVAAGCSAVQWLPGLGWLEGSARLDGAALHVHAPAAGLLDFFSRDATSAVNSVGSLLPAGSTYLGIAGLALALFGLLRWRRCPTVPMFALLALASVLVAFGVPPLYNLASVLPVLRGMRLHFLLMVADLSIAVLAAHGFVQLREAASTRTATVGLARTYAVVGITLLAGVALLATKTRQGLSMWFSFAHGPIGAGLLAISTLVLLLPAVIRRRKAVVLLVLVMGLDLATWSIGYREFSASSADAYRTPAVIAALHRYDPSSTYRILDAGRTMPLNFATPLGVADPLGYGPYEAETVDYWAGLTRQPSAGHMTALPSRLAAEPDPRLDLADVKYVLVSTRPHGGFGSFSQEPWAFRLVLQVGDVAVFENVRDLGPAVVVPAAGVHEGTDSAAARVVDSPNFAPTEQAVVATNLRARDPGTSTDTTACNCATDFRFAGSTTTFQVSAKRASLAVVSQSWYPGWHATVNGRPVPVTRTDLTLTGVPIPPGTSRVVLSFQPASMTFGIVISAATTFAVLGIAMTYWWRAPSRRRRREPSGSRRVRGLP
jgi:hypothetical protein